MHSFSSDLAYNHQSSLLNSARSSASPPLPPTDDAIEAIIQQATSARPLPEGRPLRDTRTQLFIGNLPYRVRWQDLKDLFRKAGTVLRADVSLGPDNRSRGYGTVLLATAEDAGRAVDMFNGYSWQTRVLEVRLDRLLPDYDTQFSSLGSSTANTSSSSPYPSQASSSSRPGPGSSRSDEPEFLSSYQGSDPNSCRNLFVGNLPFHCQWQDLKDLFRQAGTIMRADVALGPDGRSRGFGTVVFATEYDAERAVKMFNGYDYNNRVLKVHYDKYTPASLPATTPASPVGGSMSRNRPSEIELPPGFMFDYGPPTGPSSPYEMFSQLQQRHQQRQQQSQMHQPQAQYFHQQSEQQQRQQRQQHLQSQILNPQSFDIDRLTNSLASTDLSSSSQQSQTQPPSAHKPSPISTTTSSSSTTTTSSSSENSLASTCASSLESPIPSQSQRQQQSQHSSHSHPHPHHPGPITLPPLRPPPFPASPHTPHASGLSLSPLYHPSMGPSYPMYASTSGAAAAYQQHQHSQMVPLTPHGLPPITPSMPPFTLFLPPPSQGRETAQRRQQQHPTASSSLNASLAAGAPASGSSQSAAGSAAPSSSSSTSVPPPNAAEIYPPSSSNFDLNKGAPKAAASRQYQHQQQQYQHPQQPHSFTTPNHFVVPLPSPGFYLPSHAQHALPSPPIVHPHLRLNLAGIPGAFSPGVAMSPGTFYGRPGEANPNPAINMAVGAPVHVHSPGVPVGGMPPPPGHDVMHGHGLTPHVSHGAYFYMVSGPKNAPSGTEPKGYFDPMYFPAGGVAGGAAVGGSALVNEIMQDKEKSPEGTTAGTSSSDTVRVNDAGEDASPPVDASVGTDTPATSAASSSSTSLSSWPSHIHDHKLTQTQSADAVNMAVMNEGSTISRTHSVGYKKKAAAPAPGAVAGFGRGYSEPQLGGTAVAESGSASDGGGGGRQGR